MESNEFAFFLVPFFPFFVPFPKVFLVATEVASYSPDYSIFSSFSSFSSSITFTSSYSYSSFSSFFFFVVFFEDGGLLRATLSSSTIFPEPFSAIFSISKVSSDSIFFSFLTVAFFFFLVAVFNSSFSFWELWFTLFSSSSSSKSITWPFSPFTSIWHSKSYFAFLANFFFAAAIPVFLGFFFSAPSSSSAAFFSYFSFSSSNDTPSWAA